MTDRYIEVLDPSQMLAALHAIGIVECDGPLYDAEGKIVGRRIRSTNDAATAYFPNHPVKRAVVEQTGTDQDGNPTFTTVTPAVRKNVLLIRDRSPDGAFEGKLDAKVEQIVPEIRDRDGNVTQERQRISKIPAAQRTTFKLIDPDDPAFPDLPRFT